MNPPRSFLLSRVDMAPTSSFLGVDPVPRSPDEPRRLPVLLPCPTAPPEPSSGPSSSNGTSPGGVWPVFNFSMTRCTSYVNQPRRYLSLHSHLLALQQCGEAQKRQPSGSTAGLFTDVAFICSDAFSRPDMHRAIMGRTSPSTRLLSFIINLNWQMRFSSSFCIC